MKINFELLLLYSSVIQVHGWGMIGHKLIAQLAQKKLEKEVNSCMIQLLEPEHKSDLGAIASWPDLIIHPTLNLNKTIDWNWSRRHHYVSRPFGSCDYDINRDCPKMNCIHGAILNYTDRLTSNKDRTQRQQALYFLVHFIGEIHQPFHVGYFRDRGANRVNGRKLFETVKIVENRFSFIFRIEFDIISP